jgi:hypothetical protein
VIAAFGYLFACVVFGFLCGAFALYGGTGGLVAAVVCLIVACFAGRRAFRATAPPP